MSKSEKPIRRPVYVYIRFIRKKTSVDKLLLEYMSKKLNTR